MSEATLLKDGRFRPQEMQLDDKAGQYGWNRKDTFGKTGKFKLISKRDLRVDDSYQRPQSIQKARRIARDFNWVAFGVLVVSERNNGAHFVLDGGHRCLSTVMRPEIDTVPCYVLTGLTKAEEARAFVRMNAHRKAPTGIELFGADVVSGNPDAIAVNKKLKEFGISVANDDCRCPRALLAIQNRDPELLDDTLLLIAEAWGSDPARLLHEVMAGVAVFLPVAHAAGVSTDECASVFKKLDLTALRQKANGFRQLAALNKPVSFCHAMIDAFNKGRRINKLSYQEYVASQRIRRSGEEPATNGNGNGHH